GQTRRVSGGGSASGGGGGGGTLAGAGLRQTGGRLPAIAPRMMAPAASPPTIPAATPQPTQFACAGNDIAAARVPAAASTMMVFFMSVLSGQDPLAPIIHPKSLRDL